MMEVKPNMEIDADSIILPSELDYAINLRRDPWAVVDITYRWPRKIGSTTLALVSTTTLRCDNLQNLRCEELDGQYFIVNGTDDKSSYFVRFSVMNKRIGCEIIRAVLDRLKPLKKAKIDPVSAIEVPPVIKQYNNLAEEYSAVIFTCFAGVLTFSASVWFLFR